MDKYVPFWTLTERALDFCFEKFPEVDRLLKKALLDAYMKLDAYPDTTPTLAALRAKGMQTAILSNGSTETLSSAVKTARLRDVLDFVLSVDEIECFKPSLDVYDVAIDALQLQPEEIGFVSSNRWDVAGARNAGFMPIWVNRSCNPDEYESFKPMTVVKSLNEIAEI